MRIHAELETLAHKPHRRLASQNIVSGEAEFFSRGLDICERKLKNKSKRTFFHYPVIRLEKPERYKSETLRINTINNI